MLEIPFWQQYNLTVEEAASYFRIGRDKLRRIASDHQDAPFILWNGSRPLFKRSLFEEYLDEQNTI